MFDAKAITGWTGPSWIVEREELWLQLTDRVSTDGAGEASRENHLFAVVLFFHRRDQGDAVGQFQRRFERFGEALLQVVADLETVHHNVDGVLFLLIQLRQFIELVESTVDPRAYKTLGA